MYIKTVIHKLYILDLDEAYTIYINTHQPPAHDFQIFFYVLFLEHQKIYIFCDFIKKKVPTYLGGFTHILLFSSS